MDSDDDEEGSDYEVDSAEEEGALQFLAWPAGTPGAGASWLAGLHKIGLP